MSSSSTATTLWPSSSAYPGPVFSGDLGDSDIYGGQQHAPLLDIEVPGLDGS